MRPFESTDDAPLQFIRYVLGYGSRIGQQVASLLTPNMGRTYCLIPANSSLPDQLDFQVGGRANLDESIDELCQVLKGVIDRHDDVLALFENRCSQIGDAYLQRAKSAVATLGEEAYHFWYYRNATEQLRTAIVESGTSLYTGGFVFELPEPVEMAKQQDDWLEAFTRWRCVLAFVTAFDGETFVVWDSSH